MRRSLVVLGVIVFLLLLITFVPTLLARHFMSSLLQDFGIEYEGIDTLEVKVWKREAWVGPVFFRGGEHDRGQIRRLGIKLRVLPVVQKHAFIERVFVEGIDIVVTRAEDGTLRLNGIPLTQFVQPTEEPETREQGGKAWGAGLLNLDLRDSRLIFDDETRGKLTVEIDELRLDDFKTWEPDEEGSFVLNARLNDIAFEWMGTVRPFAEDITVAINGGTKGVELGKIMAFTGELGLDRYAGVINTETQYGLTLKASGTVEGTAEIHIEALGVDYAKSGVFAAAFERADIDLDTRFVLNEQGDLQIGGQIAGALDELNGSFSEDQSFQASRLDLDFEDLDASLGADQSLRVSARPRIAGQAGRFSGPVRLSMDSVLGVLSYLQSLSAGEPVEQGETGLADWAGGEATVPSSDVKIDAFETTASAFDLSTAQGSVALDLSSATTLTGIEIASGERGTTIETLESRLERLELRSGEGALSLDLVGNHGLRGARAEGPNGMLSLEDLETEVGQLGLEVRQGRIAVGTSSSTRLKGATLSANPIRDLPEAAAELQAASLDLKHGEFALDGERVTWEVEARSGLTGASVQYAKGNIADAKLKRLDLDGFRADQDLRVGMEALTLTGVDVSLTRRFINGLLGKSEQDAAAGEMRTQVDGGASVELVKAIQEALAGRGYAPGPADGQNGPRTQEAIRAFQRDSGRSVDGQPSEALLAALRSSGVGRGQPPEPQAKLGRFALVDGARIRFRDSTVSPEVKILTEIETLELRDVDTADPGKLAHAQFLARINEFTQVSAEGSASARSPDTNLKAKARIEQLELPTLSPYVAELAGVYMESGQLTTSADVTSGEGGLDGNIELQVFQPQFAPLTEEDSQRLAEKAGVPIETAVNLLQDADGRIELSFPVGGTLQEPDVDISGAINKAIGNALKKVFPPTMVVSMLSSMSEGAGGPSFEPVVFPAGSGELDAAGRSYADELAALMKEKPRLRLQVCGRATAADLAAVAGTTAVSLSSPESKEAAAAAEAARSALLEKHSSALSELAIERTRAVRRYLINEKALDPSRLSECRVEVLADDEGPPRVKVSL